MDENRMFIIILLGIVFLSFKKYLLKIIIYKSQSNYLGIIVINLIFAHYVIHKIIISLLQC